MRVRKLFISLGIVGGLIAMGCQSDSSTGPTDVPSPSFARKTAGTGSGPVEADHYLVEFRGSVAHLQAVVQKAGGSLMRAHPEIGVATVGDLDDAEASALWRGRGVTRVTRDLMVQWVPSAEDFNLEATAQGANEGHVVGDPTTASFYPCQWNMSQCNGPGAWAAGEFGAGATVAVLDTGTDPNHQDLAGRIDVGNSTTFVSANDPFCLANGADDVNSFFDFNFHGTFVSGLVAGNGLGVTGIAPDAWIVGVKVLNCLGVGSFADVIAGIIYAANLHVDVINMSLGAYFPKHLPGGGPLVAALSKAVNFANSHGVLVVSSAGNDGAGPGVGADLDHDRNFVHVPSQAGAGIGVWAGDVDGNLAGYSNFGLTGASVGAGGGDGIDPSPLLPGCVLPAFGQGGIISVCSTHSIFFGCGTASYLFNGAGTSFSAPLVSGVAALVDGQAGGGLNGGQLKTILSQTADDLGKVGADGVFSHGRVNAGNAVN